MPGLEFRKADILECEAGHGVRSLERIAATPGCPIEPIAQGPLAAGNPIDVHDADHSSFELHGKTISLAGQPFALVIGKPPSDLLSVGRK
jgi:hypothetical protein